MNKKLLFPILILLTACGAAWAMGPATKMDRKTAEQASVAIEVTCPDGKQFGGSGWAIDRRHVITAYHVIDCAEGSAIKVVVKTAQGRAYEVIEDFSQPEQDVTRLVVTGTEEPFTTVAVISPRRPKDGEEVCTWSGLHKKLSCGRVIKTMKGGLIAVQLDVVPGDSGSIVYDESGAAIATVNAYVPGASPPVGLLSGAWHWAPEVRQVEAPAVDMD
jgi:hypothetical protein